MRAGGRCDRAWLGAGWTDAATCTHMAIGPHVVSNEHVNFLRLLDRLGTASQIAWQPDPLVDLLDAGELLRMRNVRWTPPLHGWPNLPLEQCSAASALRVFRLMLGRCGYHFGFPKVGLSSLCTGMRGGDPRRGWRGAAARGGAGPGRARDGGMRGKAAGWQPCGGTRLRPRAAAVACGTGPGTTGSSTSQSTSAPVTNQMGAGPDTTTMGREDNDRDIGWLGLLGLAGLLGMRRKHHDDHMDTRRTSSAR